MTGYVGRGLSTLDSYGRDANANGAIAVCSQAKTLDRSPSDKEKKLITGKLFNSVTIFQY